MAAKASPTSAATAVAAGVKTPGSGAYSDPATVGAMIQKMYPQYANFDAATLGQRWIDVHTPTASTTAGAGTDVLQGPTGTTPTTTTDPNAPDLSGLGKYAQPIKPQAPKVSITANAGGLALGGQGSITGGAQLNPMTNPYQAPQPQPQAPKLSTFDINKAGF